MAVSGAVAGVTMLGGVFAWTYSQFTSVTAHASDSDQRISKVEEAISTLKENSVETRNDVKEILKSLKK